MTGISVSTVRCTLFFDIIYAKADSIGRNASSLQLKARIESRTEEEKGGGLFLDSSSREGTKCKCGTSLKGREKAFIEVDCMFGIRIETEHVTGVRRIMTSFEFRVYRG